MSRRQLYIKRKKKRFNTLFFILILTAVCTGIFSSLLTTAKEKPMSEDMSVKYYTSVQLEKGDTLWTIAHRYMTDEYQSVDEYVREVKEINSLSGDTIHSSRYITVPYYSSGQTE